MAMNEGQSQVALVVELPVSSVAENGRHHQTTTVQAIV